MKKADLVKAFQKNSTIWKKSLTHINGDVRKSAEYRLNKNNSHIAWLKTYQKTDVNALDIVQMLQDMF